jgi:hypothetical protein
LVSSHKLIGKIAFSGIQTLAYMGDKLKLELLPVIYEKLFALNLN